MTVKLTNYDTGGHRWTIDRTIRLTPQHAGIYLPTDRRAKIVGWQVFDTLERETTPVRTLTDARELAAAILAGRPGLSWGGWYRIAQEPPNLRRLCEAASAAGPVTAWVYLMQYPTIGGMWAVGYQVGKGPDARSAEWLSDIAHIPHRMAHVRAIAQNRIAEIGAPA